LSTASISVIAFGNVRLDVSVSFDDEEYEIDEMTIAGMAFEWQGVTVDGKDFEDIINNQILDPLDSIGWARGQQAADRADFKRKE
jgi:hypothetical protein